MVRSRFTIFVLALALAPQASAQSATQPSSVIVTQGISTMRVAPDQAWVVLSVEARESKAANARRSAATQMTAVQTAMKSAGLPGDGIKTTGFGLQPQMEADGAKWRVREYVARNEVEIRVDSLDILGDVLDAASSLKTSNSVSVSINELRFDLKNRPAVEEESLRRAVQDAMSRARAMAGGAGRTLGTIVRIEELRVPETSTVIPLTVLRPAGIAMRGASGAGGAGGGQIAGPGTPIEPNQIEIRTEVSVMVAIN